MNEDNCDIISCYLCTDNVSYPSIYLPNNKPVVVGRNVDTKITDVKCSREQVRLCANYHEKNVTIEQLGKQPCGLNGNKTIRHKKYIAKNGDQLEIIHGKYSYKFEFNSSSPDKSLKKCLQDKDHAIFKKRSHCDIDDANEDCNEAGTSKKCKIEEKLASPTNIKVTEELSVANKMTEKWDTIDKNHLLIYTANDCKSQQKIASFDMDGTLITTKSGAVFPKNTDDWKLLYPQIPKKLKELYDSDFKIVIFTNQNGVGTGKINLNDFKSKIEAVVKKLGVPIQVFIATSKDHYRKPITGMWERLVKYNNDNININKDESFYVGDAAGRPKDWIPKAKKDHSSVDRLFAKNIGIKFYTPEEYFLGHKLAKFNNPIFDPNKLTDDIPIFIPANALENSNNQEVIIMVGGPGSGKTFVVSKYLKNYSHINRDTLGSWQKCVSAMENILSKGRSVVIDNTNPDVTSRKRFIDVAQAKNIPVRCFLMTTQVEHAKHNNKFRELSNSNHSVVSDIVINSYYKNYVEPTLDEGFIDIVKVNFVPKFDSDDKKQLYQMYLLEK
ncbi:uncharacterized protein F21D5.5 [Chelonus insularis]|uniref:uncharacterized protein F21D5.5 n=1 Tax=Chelonus insularis TaxID=460826 RepID=UPI00158AE346|nr:uncharacterized protein F21D5.5 [Chelonus insularis]